MPPALFASPTGIATDNTYVYVAALYYGVQSLFKFDVSGNIVGTPVNLSGYTISGIVYVPQYSILACDTSGNQILQIVNNLVTVLLGITAGTPNCITTDNSNIFVGSTTNVGGTTTGHVTKILLTNVGSQIDLITADLDSVTGISYYLGSDVSGTTLGVCDGVAGKYYVVDVTESTPITPSLQGSTLGSIQDIFRYSFTNEGGIFYTLPGSVMLLVDGGTPGTAATNPYSQTGLSYLTMSYDTNGIGLNMYISDYANNAIRIFSYGTFENSPQALTTLYAGGGGGGGAPCFLQGSTILCQVDGKDVYVPIEQMMPGTLVKTRLSGYKKVILLGRRAFMNPGTDVKDRLEQRLYTLSSAAYPELTEDLYLTGGHSVLVESLSDEQKEKTVAHLGELFVTENRYRLLACIDERAEAWDSEGEHTIWHFALEHDVVNANYGVYANGGLLVESSSINYMKNKSNMILEA